MANHITDLLSQAIAKGDFQAVSGLIDQYGRTVARDFQVAPNNAERTVIVNQAVAFLQDHLHMARVMRSHLHAQLKALSRTSSYSETRSSQNTWQMEG